MQISASAIDYSQPYNVVPNYLRLMGAASTFTVENDWIQTSAYRTFTGEVDISSVRVSAVGSDNYGTKYEKWLSIYINGGQYSGRLIYDSGWTTDDIDDSVLAFSSDVTSVRIVYRLRYADSTANPPNVNYLNNATVIIYYNSFEQIPADTTAIPNGWTVDTTVSQSTYSTYPTVTTTISPDDVGELVDAYSPINLVWFTEQLGIFGIVTGWIVSDLPWVLVLICWFLICSIIYWLLK